VTVAVHSGWLWKKGALTKSQLTNQRWFEIKGDQMYYFKSKGENHALGQISLPGNEVVKHSLLADSNGRYLFELIAGKEREGRPVSEHHDTLLFGASSIREMEDWIKAMNRVIYTPSGGGMFGRSLIETIRIDSQRGGGMVPIIVEKCVTYLKKAGVSEEGLFRVPGKQADVEALKNAFNKGEINDFTEEKHSVNIVASLLKQYIADLPDPIIPTEYYDQFLAVVGLYNTNANAAVEKFEYLLNRIPRAHFNLLKYLSRFLYDLQLVQKTTKMDLNNLATVFGPILLRPQDEDPIFLMKSLGHVNATLKAIIENQEKLFPESSDEKFYSPKEPDDTCVFAELINFDNPCLNNVVVYPELPSHLTNEKRSFSEGNLLNLMKDEMGFSNGVRVGAYEEKILELQDKVEIQQKSHQEQLRDLELKLENQIKIQQMLKIRLADEHKARIAAEERNESYRAGIEEYCRKFGHIDICIP